MVGGVGGLPRTLNMRLVNIFRLWTGLRKGRKEAGREGRKEGRKEGREEGKKEGRRDRREGQREGGRKEGRKGIYGKGDWRWEVEGEKRER